MLYFANMKIAQAFHPLLSSFEVILRNQLHYVLKTVDIRSPKTGISVHFSYSLPMAMQIY